MLGLYKHLKTKADSFISRNALLLVILSYLFMPYAPKPGYFTFNALIIFLLGFYILLSRIEVKADKTILVLLAVFIAYDFLFIFKKGFSFSIFRANAFGLLTFVIIVVYSNKESIRRLLTGLLVWSSLSFVIVVAQLIVGDFFYTPYYWGYYWGVKKEALFNFFRISVPLGFNFSKTQFGGQGAFLVPFLLSLWMLPRFKSMIRWYHIVALAGILAFPFSRAAWVGVFSALFIIFAFRYEAYLRKGLLFILLFSLMLFAVKLDIREHKSIDLTSPSPVVSSYKNSDLIEQTVNVNSDISANTRVVLVKTGLRMFESHPLGGGAGAFRKEYGQFRQIDDKVENSADKLAVLSGSKEDVRVKTKKDIVPPKAAFPKTIERKKIDERLDLAPHNSYIQIAVEKGILGLLLFVSIIFKVLRDLYKKGREVKGSCYAGIFAGFLSLLIYGFFHEIVPDRMFWIALGLATAALNKSDAFAADY